MGDDGEIWAVIVPGRLQQVAANAARLGCRSMPSRLTLHLFSRSVRNGKGCSSASCWMLPAQTGYVVAPSRCALAHHGRIGGGLLPCAGCGWLVALLAPGGCFVYATCTIHPDENTRQIQGWLQRHPKLSLQSEQQRWPDPSGGDGFYAAVITAPAAA